MSKFVLTEFLNFESERYASLISDQERAEMEEGSAYYLAGVMQRADAKNGNGRVYPHNLLEREVENYKKLVKEKRSYGELDHPDSPIVELRNASHLVTHIEMRGKEVVGKIKLLDTVAGNTAKGIHKSGGLLSISSRGLGSTVEKNGETHVEEDFQLVCFDLVSEPSTTGAFMLNEGKESSPYGKADKINRSLNNIMRLKEKHAKR